MKIRLEDIPAEGLDVSFESQVGSPEELAPQLKEMRGPVHARMKLTRKGDKVLVKGHWAADVVVECSRCLGDVGLSLEAPLELAFIPSPMDRVEEIALAGDDLEVAFMEQGEIDLGRAVRDELALVLPMAPLCREDCRGLCPSCGADLAEGDCGCSAKKNDPRWAKLSGLKLD